LLTGKNSAEGNTRLDSAEGQRVGP